MNKPSHSQQRQWRHRDLRDLLRRFEEMDEIETVKGAACDLEIAAISEMTAAANPGRARALLFEEIPGFDPGYRILSGASNSYRRLAAILGFEAPSREMDVVQAYRDRMHDDYKTIPPQTVEDGPVLENVRGDGEIDLSAYPAPLQHEGDGGRYIGTDDVVIMRDPDTGWVNCASYRVMVHDKDTCGIWIGPGHHGRLIREKYFKKGKPCPVLVCCGQDPLLFLAAHSEIAHGLSEYDYAGGHRGRPFEVIESELHGLPMPAAAEFVLEGEIYGDELKMEGPLGGFMGYYAAPAREQPVMKVRRLYHRDDPIFMLAVTSKPPANYTFARSTVKSAIIWDEMEKAGLPGIKGVWCHEAGAGRLFNVISIEQMHGGHARQAALVAAGCQSGNYSGRWVIVVDDDIDPANMFEVCWALSTRCDPANDVDFIRGGWTTPADPMAHGDPPLNSRALVDACKPFGADAGFPDVVEASAEVKARVMKKFPDLFR